MTLVEAAMGDIGPSSAAGALSAFKEISSQDPPLEMAAPAAASAEDAGTVMLRRNGGVTQAVVCGVRLEVVHVDSAAGAGTEGAEDDDGEDAALEMWTWFFEEGFSLASATGFARVWPGGAALVRSVGDADSALRLALAQASEAAGRSARCLELGAGCGLVGLAAAAAAGADVLLTDTAAVVNGVLARNLRHNSGASVPPAATDGAHSSAAAEPWPGAVAVGTGRAAVAVLDWTVPVGEQLQGCSAAPDVVLAAECVWLAELIEPFADAAAALLLSRQGSCSSAEPREGEDRQGHDTREDGQAALPPPVLFLSSRERARSGSTTFAPVGAALAALAARGCGDCRLVERHEAGGGQDDEDEDSPLLVYAVRPDKP
mmetsp:Transcript_140474/g.356446  ORF Transcript_140474/g.356446 Transcript_140474/m.356446 type:complete len:374 (-) Transcript_140474:32-1153(-)